MSESSTPPNYNLRAHQSVMLPDDVEAVLGPHVSPVTSPNPSRRHVNVQRLCVDSDGTSAPAQILLSRCIESSLFYPVFCIHRA